MYHGVHFTFREMFFKLLNEIVQNHFKTSFDKLLRHLATGPKVKDDDIRSLFFGDYMSGSGESKVYDEVTDYSKLTEAMERWVTLWAWCLVLFACLCLYMCLCYNWNCVTSWNLSL